MNEEKLLEIGLNAGKLLLESGAEVFRVEDTMNRICLSFPGVEHAESFVASTGIFLSVEIDGQSFAKLCRVRNRAVNLECIEQINTLSRKLQVENYTLEQVEKELDDIKNKPRFSNILMILSGAIGAGGFAWFFDGGIKEILISFVIGLIVRCVILLLSMFNLNDFLKNLISSSLIAYMAYIACKWIVRANMNIIIISGIMLLIPGLALTNAIRDTMAGDYLSGLSRAMEAIILAAAIALGVAVVLSVVIV